MSLPNSSFFVILFHLLSLSLLVNLAYSSKCPTSFECGDLGTLKFPFSNMQPNCGLFMVNCTTPTPSVQFQFGENNWYDILHKNSTNSFHVRNNLLESRLENRNCYSFSNQSLPNSPLTSFTISSNLTLFLCYNESRVEPINEYFHNYTSHMCPSMFSVYYTNSSYNSSVVNDGGRTIPEGCSMIQMPLDSSNRDSVDVFEMIASEFTIEWNISQECIDCHNRGGQCTTNNMNEYLCKLEGRSRGRTFLIFATAGSLFMLVISVITLNHFRIKYKVCEKIFRGQTDRVKRKDIKLFLKRHGNLAHKLYKFSDIKKMTGSFRDKLGNGGYGDVYKGKLPDGRLVAVKILRESKANGEDFINEVDSISLTSHVNIVSLLGFCFEGSKRALIYEFMPNGSLENFISSSNSSSSSTIVRLGWEKLYDIAVGIARGLEYLHRGCNTQIVHFDIKPHNILLDENLTPKISDFGLAKLCPSRSSIVSMIGARGTIGYIAPEVFCRNFGEVSHKSDVYSYGMMVLEMAMGKQDTNSKADCSSQMYFPASIYKYLESNHENGVDHDSILNEDESRICRKMIIVGLWCIQTDPKKRPSVSRVLEMLEGNVELLEIPPKPHLSSPPRTISNASSFDSSILM